MCIRDSRRHIGKFEQCSDGTVFLDEIGDMSPLLQSKVLRLLQEQQFERVGGTATISTNSRIISATNRNLEEMISESEFRLDLYHRINAIEIFLPPLREREGDIRLLTSFFIRRFSHSLGKDVEGISVDAVEMLHNYPWPGNVRELQSTIRRAILMATGPVIVPENLLLETVAPPSTPESTQLNSNDVQLESFVQQRIDAGSNEVYAETLELMERSLLTKILRHTGGNQSHAAEILGITRGSLRHKIRALNIQIEQVIS